MIPENDVCGCSFCIEFRSRKIRERIKTEISYGVDKPMTNPQKFWPCEHIAKVIGEMSIQYDWIYLNKYYIKSDEKFCPQCGAQRPPQPPSDWLVDILKQWYGTTHNESQEIAKEIRAHIEKEGPKCSNHGMFACVADGYTQCDSQKAWLQFLGIERKDGGK